MLPSLSITNGQNINNSSIEQNNNPIFIKQLKKINSSPIRNNPIRTLSADYEQITIRKTIEINEKKEENNNNPQSMAILRVMKSIRKQRLIQQKTEV